MYSVIINVSNIGRWSTVNTFKRKGTKGPT